MTGRPVVGILVLAAVLAGCGDKTVPGPRVSGLTAAGPVSQTGTVGQSLEQQLRVRAVDALGQGVQGVEITWSVTSGDGAVSPARTVTDVDGIAAASWQLGPTAGGQGARAALTSAHSVAFTATATPGPATVLDLTPTTANLTAIGDTVRLVAVARDMYGNATDAGAISWSTSATGVATVHDGLVTAVSPGAATISATGSGTAAGEVLVSVSQAPATAQVTPGDVTFSAVGQAATVTAVIRDRNGVELVGAAPSWASRNEAVATIDVNGSVVARGAGSTYVVAALGAASDSAQVTVAQVPGQLVVVEGSGGTAPAGGSRTLRVRVLDAGGTAIAGVPVTWSAQAGSIDVGPTLTDAAGEATSEWTVGTTPGVQTAGAAVTGVAPVSFAATVVAAAASPVTSTLAVGSPTLVADGASSTVVTVTLRDQHGNPHTTGGVPVTVATTGGTVAAGSASGASVAAVDAGNGSYTATLVAPTTVGEAAVSASVDGAPLSASASVTFVHGAAATLVVLAGNDLTAVAGTATATAPSVRVQDAHGNAVPGTSVTFTVTAGGGSVGGAASQNVVSGSDGVATAGAWTVGTVAGSAQQLTATATGAAAAVFAASVTHAAAAALSIETQPAADARAGIQFTTQPVVRLRDAYGNAVPQGGVGIRADLVQPGALLGNPWATTDATGVATFADLAIGAVVGNYTLAFTVDGLSGATSAAIALAPGIAATLSFESGGGWVAVAGSDRLVEAGVYDAWSNGVPGHAVTWEVGDPSFGTISAGGNTGTVVSSHTAADGVAQAWWHMPTQTGSVFAFASAYNDDGGLLPLSPWRYDATVVPDEPVQLGIITQPPAGAQSGVAFAQPPVIELQDQYGNAVTHVAVPVAVEIATGTGTLQGTLGGLTEEGRFTFTGLGIVGTGAHTLRFFSHGHTPAVSSVIDVQP